MRFGGVDQKNSHNSNEIIIFYKTLIDFLDEHDFTYKIWSTFLILIDEYIIQ